MLNKLLKRCMPWMDKGRWYNIVFAASNGNYVIGDGTDPAFQSADAVVQIDDYGNTILVIHTNIVVREVKLRQLDGNRSTYMSVPLRSDWHSLQLFIPEWFGLTPSDGNPLEILVYGA